jgi:hypothetical protein
MSKSKLFWNVKLSPVLLGATLLLANRTEAKSIAPVSKLAPAAATTSQTSGSIKPALFGARLLAQTVPAAKANVNQTNNQLQQIAQYSQAPTAPIAQVTSVSQLSDVQPTDWAFQALQSLVERYGCIAGYPDKTYRGNRALTRYEFAAGLNSCLDRVNELIAAGTSGMVSKQDLATLKRLQEEYSAELATLRGRVDSLEARTAQVEANQFSTTTKLVGEAIFAVSGVGGDRRAVPSGRQRGALGNIYDNEVFADRIRLSLNTSFSGRDLLRTRLQSRNLTSFNTAVTGTNMTRLSFEGDEGNSTNVDQLFYRLPLGKNIVAQVDAANVELNERGFPTFSPFESNATGAISRYGRYSPIYRLANNSLTSGNSILNSGAAPGVSFHINPQGAIGLDLGYIAETANNPSRGNGIGNGSYVAIGQIDINVNKAFNLGLTYAHGYDNRSRRIINNQNAVSLFDFTGSQLAESPFGNVATTTNNFGVEGSFRPNKHIILFGWGGYTQAIAEASPSGGPVVSQYNQTTAVTGTGDRITGRRGSQANIWYYAGGLAFPDFGKKGNLLGFLFGQSPKLTASNVRETFRNPNGTVVNRRRVDTGTSYHAEAFLRYRLTDNIDITPGVLVIVNPEYNRSNPMDYVGTLRTTFRF